MVTPNPPGSAREEWKSSWQIPAISAVAIGVSVIPNYSLGALMPAIHASTGWTRAEISAGPTFLSVGAVLLAPFVGMAIDRVGSRRIALPGLILSCAAIGSLALTSNKLATWWLAWTLIAIADVLVKTTVWTAAVVSRFHHARGAAIGLALAGTGLATTFLPYLTTVLQEAYGWRAAYALLAGGGFVLAFPLVYLFFFDANDALRRTASTQVDRSTLPGVPLRKAFLSRRYVQLAIATLFTATAGTALAVHFVPILRSEGLAARTAAATAGALGVAVIVGRIAGGYLLDKWGGPTVGFVSSVLPVLVCPILLLYHTSTFGIVAAVLTGLSAGAEVNVIAYLVPRYFGARHFGLLFGSLQALLMVGAGLGPFLGGYLFDRSGNYRNLLLLTVPLFLISAILLGTLGRKSTDRNLLDAGTAAI